MDSSERAKVFEMWSDYRQLVRDLCLSCVAEYNNLLADLVAGVALKASLVETAFARRIATVKSRIGSISTRLAPQLIGLSQAKVKELLLELVNESLEELTGIDAAELFDKAVLDIAPEKPIGETEVNDE